jgi:hypothetical protein
MGDCHNSWLHGYENPCQQKQQSDFGWLATIAKESNQDKEEAAAVTSAWNFDLELCQAALSKRVNITFDRF